MSIGTDVARIKGNITAALAAIADKGVTVPDGSTSDALAGLIASIEAGGSGLDFSTIGYKGGASGSVTFETDCRVIEFSYIGEPAIILLIYTEDLDALYASTGGTYTNKRLYGAFKTVVTNIDKTTTNLLVELDGNYSGEKLCIDAGSVITSKYYGTNSNRYISIKTESSTSGSCSVEIFTRNTSSGAYSQAASGATYKWLVLW